MSEFTDAVLVHMRDAAVSLEAMKSYPYHFLSRELNNRWLAIFPEHVNNSRKPIHSWMQQASTMFPCIYFQNAPDHGWDYQIFSDGQVVAQVQVNYDLSYRIWLNRVKERYPEIDDPIAEIGLDARQRMITEIEASDDFKVRVAAQYAYAYPEILQVFGFSNKDIEDIRATLATEWYLDIERRFEQVNAFMREVELEGLEWMSFRYLNK